MRLLSDALRPHAWATVSDDFRSRSRAGSIFLALLHSRTALIAGSPVSRRGVDLQSESARLARAQYRTRTATAHPGECELAARNDRATSVPKKPSPKKRCAVGAFTSVPSRALRMKRAPAGQSSTKKCAQYLREYLDATM
jgi:hypothetical protein